VFKLQVVNHQNLIPVPVQKCIKNNLSVTCINARSVKNKASELADFITDKDIDILAITETWLTSGERDRLSRGELTPKGYHLIDVSRSKGRGGGVGVVHKDTLSVKQQLITAERSSFECVELLISSGSDVIRLAVVYRPPAGGKSGQPTAVFLDEFHKYVDGLATTSGRLLIVGDFNFHFEDVNDIDAQKFKDLLFGFDLQQHVVGPTHKHGHMLDLVITRCLELDVQNLLTHGAVISDHSAVSFVLPHPKPVAGRKKVTFRKLKDIDIPAFQNDITNSALCESQTTNLEDLVSQYNKTLTAILDEHAPLQSKYITLRPHSPWFNEDIKKAKICRRTAERQWRRTKLTVHYEIYRSEHRRVIDLCMVAKKEYYQSKINDCNNDQKQIFKLADGLLFKKKSSALPTHLDSVDMANKFADYFSLKISGIRKDIIQNQPPDVKQYHCVSNVSVPQLQELRPTNEKELLEIITSSNSKCCLLDPIPTALLKKCMDSLLPVLTKIVNISLAMSSVPTTFKQAIVTPLLKKPSADKENMKNYRPVSNLPYAAKLLEKVVVKRLNEHMDIYDLHEPLQSAYRKLHSTETALVKVFNDIVCAVDSKQCVLLILLDLSAAFDTIDHDIMLQQLEGVFGITGSALMWLKSYFSDRSQSVSISNKSSGPHDLDSGVPQGSVAGPFTFPKYTQQLAAIAREFGISIHLYADDTQLYIGFDVDESEPSKVRLEACIVKIRAWMSANMLKLNDSKTEYLLIGSKHTLKKVPDHLSSIHVGDANVEATSSARNIGVVIDSTLSMESHIRCLLRSCYASLRDIGKVRGYLTEHSAKLLVHAYVTSKLDSLNSLLYGLPQYQIQKLQLIQNHAARIIARKKKYEHIEHIRKELHWLPVEFRLKYKILLLVFKCLHELAPVYLCQLLELYMPSRSLRSSSQNLLIEKQPRTKIGERAFSVCGPKLWNRLPVHVRNIGDIDAFKMELKTYLFKCAFY
jgi:hypothetical protein